MLSVRDLTTKMPSAQAAVSTSTWMTSCAAVDFMRLVALKHSPIITPITTFPSAQPGIPRSPLMTTQYRMTPNTPTTVPLSVPKDQQYTAMTT